MKKLFVLMMFVAIAGILTTACSNEKPKVISRSEIVLRGNHDLRKMFNKEVTGQFVSAGFFIFAGGLTSETKTATIVKFAWKMNDGTYAISSLPLEKIRIQFDNTATTPTIKFRWREGGWTGANGNETQKIINAVVIYAIITVKEKDWPTQIKLPLS